LVALRGEHVVERTTFGHLDEAVRVRLRLVRDVLHEQQRQDVVLVLTGIHAAAELVRAGPQRTVEVRLLERHRHATTLEAVTPLLRSLLRWLVMVCSCSSAPRARLKLCSWCRVQRYRRPLTLLD